VLLRVGGVKALSDNAALIGALVALGGVFTAQLVGISLDTRRSQEARELEAQRAHEAALQKYLEQVGKLLIEHPLRDSSLGDDLSTVVRAQTLAVLQGLDPQRKRILLQFLYESGLINKDAPVISLAFANLRGVDLSETVLPKVNLVLAMMDGAIMNEAYLPGADLRGVDLLGANLREAFLPEIDLRGAALQEATLVDAALWNADLSSIPDDSIFDVVSGSILLKEFFPEGAEGDAATQLNGADLSGADLTGANLSGAEGITIETLKQQAKTLFDATLPDGSKYS